MDLG
jgi:hypothetical protein